MKSGTYLQKDLGFQNMHDVVYNESKSGGNETFLKVFLWCE